MSRGGPSNVIPPEGAFGPGIDAVLNDATVGAAFLDDAVSRAQSVQCVASDPRASVFVSASAGSGKTKLLIDRLLRLMLPARVTDAGTGKTSILGGVAPYRILSLTYTKAAAAEMSTRLQTLLGKWVTMDDGQLDQELAKLDVPVSAESRDAARALFARVLDCPGGMRIGTIHAFCQSLLRRFPLEAAVAPQFQLQEDADISAALNQALEDEILAFSEGSEGAALEELSQKRDFDTVRKFAVSLYAGRGAQRGFGTVQSFNSEALRALYERVLGLEGRDAAGAARARVTPDEEGALRAAVVTGLEIGSEAQKKRYRAMLAWLDKAQDLRDPEIWYRLLVTDKGGVRSVSTFLTKKYLESHAHIYDVISREAERVVAAHLECGLHDALNTNLTSVALVMAALRRLDRHKARLGLVDYEDLIRATRVLLHDPGAAWVLYCLDGGIDHLLLDEVQDTSPAQWKIARALTDDFFSGEADGSQGLVRPRTIFAVGDFKQSIFSFQGAEPRAFLTARRDFGRRVQDAGQVWRAPSLDVSFRSVAPVLELVDAVFDNPDAAEGLRDDAFQDGEGIPVHRPARSRDFGRVELWPRLPRDRTVEELDPWDSTASDPATRDAAQRLAESIAYWLHKRLGQPAFRGQPPLEAKDVLILVRKRAPFLWALVRALKARSIDVSTFVRTNLLDQLAVQDIIALCEVLLLPQDDLMLANVLTSPLGGLTDDSLMALALGRERQPLWTVLQQRHAARPDWTAAWDMLSGLQARLDYATPHDIFSDALGRFGGRARCLARLGAAARDAIDDLMGLALQYEAGHAPSMQGFLAWLRDSEGAIKRDAEAESSAVRIMTVHASKGLQSRLVILPDTAATSPPLTTHVNIDAGGVDLPLMTMKGVNAAPRVLAKITEDARKAREESHRLLYVALTRAQDWLVVCGWESGKDVQNGTDWYELCRKGFETLPTREVSFKGGWEGACKLHESQGASTVQQDITETGGHGQMQRNDVVPHIAPNVDVPPVPPIFGHAPDWTPLAPDAEPRRSRPLSPSRPEGALFGTLPAARSPLESIAASKRQRALRRGVIVHRLLQFLPDLPEDARGKTAQAWLAQPAFRLDPKEIVTLAQDVIGVITHPQLAPLFGPGSRAEQMITGLINDRVVVGQVDRYAYVQNCLYVCDYKTNQNPPARDDAIPETYRQQMAAYVAILRQVHAAQRVVAALVWTEGARVTFLSSEMLNA